MTKTELKDRTETFALEIIKLVDNCPSTQASRVIGNQVLRSATSVAANYRAACRAKSQKDFIYKLGIVEEKSDETLFWLALTQEANILNGAMPSFFVKRSRRVNSHFCSVT